MILKGPKRSFYLIGIIGILLLVALFLFKPQNNHTMNMTHIHGMGYSIDGERLMFAAHHGLLVYADGHWSEGPGYKHDYMGFAVHDQGFYSSGHPDPNSDLENPLGVVRSLDEGNSLELLAYYGQIDFHYLTVGYKTQTLYVYNSHSHAVMEQGLYYSEDQGTTWAKTEATGVKGEITAIATHPVESSIVVIGTDNGAFLSKDNGNSFESITSSQQITGLSFSPQGVLYMGTYDQGKPGLLAFYSKMTETSPVHIPTMDEDVVTYIAVNPLSEQDMAISTYKKHVYTSNDGGKTWNQIVELGLSK
jgi:WD40 repeat protein